MLNLELFFVLSTGSVELAGVPLFSDSYSVVAVRSLLRFFLSLARMAETFDRLLFLYSQTEMGFRQSFLTNIYTVDALVKQSTVML